jgi:hypothetical protein
MSETAAISAYWDAAAPGFDDEPVASATAKAATTARRTCTWTPG